MTFFLINFTALLSNAYPTDIAIITLKSKWAAKICGPLKWATPRKRLRNTGLEEAAIQKCPILLRQQSIATFFFI